MKADKTINKKEIKWHNGCRAALEFDYEGVTYRKGSNQCIFLCGDLVMNSSILTGAPSLQLKTTGIVLDIFQPNEIDWPVLEIIWSNDEITKEKASSLWKFVRSIDESL